MNGDVYLRAVSQAPSTVFTSEEARTLRDILYRPEMLKAFRHLQDEIEKKVTDAGLRRLDSRVDVAEHNVNVGLMHGVLFTIEGVAKKAAGREEGEIDDVVT